MKNAGLKKKDRCASHEEWRSRMDKCFNYMLLGFSLNELEILVEERKNRKKEYLENKSNE